MKEERVLLWTHTQAHMHTGRSDEDGDADASVAGSQRNRILRSIAVGSLEVRKPEDETQHCP